MVSDEELDTFVKDDLQKDINQLDKIDPSVEASLGEMGYLWNRVNEKLKEDKTCYQCKKDLEAEKDKPHLLEANGVDKGIIVFCSICNECIEKLKKEQGVENGKK